MTTTIAPEINRTLEEEQIIDDEEQQRRKLAMKVHLQQHKDKRKQHILAKRRPATLGMGGFESIKANAALLATAPDLRTELHHSNTASNSSSLHPNSNVTITHFSPPNNNNININTQQSQQQTQSQQQSTQQKNHIESTVIVSSSAPSSKEAFSSPSASNGPTPTSSSPSTSNTSSTTTTTNPTNTTNPTITITSNPTLAPDVNEHVKGHNRRGSGSASNDKLPVMTKPKQDQPQKTTNSADLRRRVSLFF